MNDYDAVNKGAVAKMEEQFSSLSATDAAFLTYRNAMRVAPAWFEERTSFEQTDLSNVWLLYKSSVTFPWVVSTKYYIEGIGLRAPNYFQYPHAADAAAILANAISIFKSGKNENNGSIGLDLVNSALGVTRTGIRPDQAQLRLCHEEILRANKDDLNAAASGISWHDKPLWRNGKPLAHQDPVLDRLRDRGGLWLTITEWYEDLVSGKFPDFDLVSGLLRIEKNVVDHDESIALAFQKVSDSRSNKSKLDIKDVKAEAQHHLSSLTALRLQEPSSNGMGHNNPPSPIDEIAESVERDLSRTVNALSSPIVNRWELRNISSSLRRGVVSLLSFLGKSAINAASKYTETALQGAITVYIAQNSDRLIKLADDILSVIGYK